MAFQRISTCRFCLRLIERKSLISLHRSPLLKKLRIDQSSAWFASQFSTNSMQSNKKSNVEEAEEEPDKPYSFSKSKAAHWTVDRSFGSQYSRPWWKVAPVSLSLFALVAWIFLRSETDLDRQLDIKLSERLPDLFPPPETESNETEADVAKDAR
nr:ubiquinol-cytochrome-c reductase complex assembly factor 4-like [Lytechinus pictus]